MAGRRPGGGAMLTPAIYRTRVTHLRRAPVHHYFEHRGYSCLLYTSDAADE